MNADLKHILTFLGIITGVVIAVNVISGKKPLPSLNQPPAESQGNFLEQVLSSRPDIQETKEDASFKWNDNFFKVTF